MGKYSKENSLGIELAGNFWHFLDFLWIYLFLFVFHSTVKFNKFALHFIKKT